MLIAVIGDQVAGSEPQEAIEPAIEHAADGLGLDRPTVRWVESDTLAGIGVARKAGVPFIGNCAGYQHAVVELARNVAGIRAANHEEYGPTVT